MEVLYLVPDNLLTPRVMLKDGHNVVLYKPPVPPEPQNPGVSSFIKPDDHTSVIDPAHVESGARNAESVRAAA